MTSTRVYREEELQENRDKRKDEIIASAKELFLEKGFSDTSMSEIAQKAKLSRKTLYRYYSSKEELAFAIEISVFEKFINLQQRLLLTVSGNGYERIREYFDRVYDYINTNSDLIRFTGIFDYYFVDEYPNCELIPQFEELAGKAHLPIVSIIEEGQKDGSVKKDIDPVLTALTISNSLLCLAQRIICRKKHLDAEQKIDSNLLIRNQINMFLKAIKN